MSSAVEGFGERGLRARALGVAGSTWDRADPRRLASGALAVLLLAAAAGLMHLTRGNTMWADEWLWAVGRRGNGVNTFLNPYNGHLSLVPVAIYKLLFAVAGLRHYVVFRAMITGGHLACVVLVYVYARRRVGAFLGLVAAGLILFFGPAWSDILWPFQIAWLIAVGCGIGALLALDRGDRRGDITASLLIASSLASTSVGVAIAAGIVVELAGKRRRWQDAWIVAIPLVLYAVWTLSYQNTSLTGNVYSIPSFGAQAYAGSLAGLLGLSGTSALNSTGTLLAFGVPLAVAATAVVVWVVRGSGGLPARGVTLAAMLLAFWCLTALGRASAIGGALSSRYLYVDGVLVVLIGCELARGARPGVVTRVAIAVAAAAAAISNVAPLRSAATFLRGESQQAKADLGALELSRPFVRSDTYAVGFPLYPLINIRAVSFFAAERSLGSVADSPAQIAASAETARQAVDTEIVNVRQLTLQPASGKATAAGITPIIDLAAGGTATRAAGCVSFAAHAVPYGAQSELQVTVAPSLLRVAASGTQASIGVRRFGSAFVPLGTVPAGTGATLRIAPDRSSAPWHLEIVTAGRAEICSIGA